MGCCTVSVQSSTAVAARRVPATSRQPPPAEEPVLTQICVAAADIRAAAEELQATLRVPGDDALKPARGIALHPFNLVDMQKLLLQMLPDRQVRENLAKWGPAVFNTRTANGGFQATVKVPGLPGAWGNRQWSGEERGHREGAEASAALAALAELAADAEFGVAVDLFGGDMPFVPLFRGQALDILVREKEGWTCCRQSKEGGVGWVPAAHVAEMATVTADHAVASSTEVLHANEGDEVEVIRRHYSGWSYCREWRGIHRAGDETREGWVTDAYLDGGCPDAKFDVLISQALTAVISGASEIHSIVSGFQKRPVGSGEAPAEWTLQCLDFVVSLGEEMDAVKHAVSGRSRLEEGKEGVAVRDANVEQPNGLRVSRGDCLKILQLSGASWVWCLAPDGREGWVPRDALREHGASLALTLAASPPAGAATIGPICAICLEPLGEPGGGGEALPCAHAFHRHCLSAWLAQKSQCPVCRVPAEGLPAPAPAAPARRWPPARAGGAAGSARGGAAGSARSRASGAGGGSFLAMMPLGR